MRKILFILFIYLLIPASLYAACSGSSPNWTAASPARDDIKDCITGATEGDTINVPAGSATWSATDGSYCSGNANTIALLCVNKGVNIIGAGAGSTNITSGASANFMISYYGAAAFRLSGFTFTSASNRSILELGISYKSAPFTIYNIRIDNNIFASIGSGTAIWNHCNYYGVVHSNTFNGSTSVAIRNNSGIASTKQYNWFETSPQNEFTPGSEKYLYYEDNTFNFTGTGTVLALEGQNSARYAARYNTFNNAASDNITVSEIHGEQGTTVSGNFGYEFYGNSIVDTNNKGVKIQMRGGQNRIFYNKATTTSFYETDIFFGTLSSCPSSYADQILVNNTYIWENRSAAGIAYQGTPSSTYSGTCGSYTNPPSWGASAFGDNSTPGVSCGTLTNMPGTCTTGAAYWATSQSCTTLTDYVGASPATPISGTLYICTATNTWTAYYTPYTYPHPLRGESDTTVPTNTQAGNSINAAGDELTLLYSESVVKTGAGTVSLTCSGGAVTPTYSSGSGTATHKYTLGRVINQAEVCTVDYTQTGNDLQDAAGNDLATYTGHTIVNGSAVSAGGTTYDLTVAVVGGGTVNSSQGGIGCTRDNTPCTKTVDDGTVITFTLVPYPGHNEGVITGTGCGTTTTMSEARSCTVTFPPIYLLN